MNSKGRFIGQNAKLNLTPNQQGYTDLKLSAFYASTAYCFHKKTHEIADGVYGKVIMVSFKADFPKTSEDWKNKIFKFDSKFADVNGANFDSEFYARYKAFQEKLMSKIIPVLKEAEELGPDIVSTIRFVGHGMGGAGYHMSLPSTNPFKNVIHTFGQPRIGNLQSIQSMLAKKLSVFRVTHMNDYLPRLPESNAFLHPPFEIWIESDCNCSSNKGIDKAYLCYGPIDTLTYTYTESNECINAQPLKSKVAHLGPYFQLMMGECPHLEFEE
ncbi:hypothetical protein G9A89_023426 [Geosiphon pyriformis]|nr:hypothetical protein G9A89_023426 [Geosiphon pyriformis]